MVTNINVDSIDVRCASLFEKMEKKELQYNDSLGWYDVDKWASVEILDRLNELAKEVKEHSEVLVVIGIGGSNQGARALIDALGNPSGVDIVWAGNTLSSFEYERVINEIGDRDFSINVIAKNFQTLEPGIAFRIFRALLKNKYGHEYNKRVYVTGTRESLLEKLCIENGWTWLDFPIDIGGRYSVLSPVGLFPIAVAGLDIYKFREGAKVASNDITSNPTTLFKYASMRYESFKNGYTMEMLSFFEPRLFRFAKWWMQLMAESEGKDNKALFPVMGSFSEDLHSIGQFIQEGSKTIIETFIKIKDSNSKYPVSLIDVDDAFEYLDGKDMDQINKVSESATIMAHSSRLPVNTIEIERLDEYNFGYLMMFFMKLCYLSGKLLDINPFDQNGVEEYKKWMFKGLGRNV